MNLGETVTYFSLKGVFLCGNIPIQTVPSVFGGRAGLNVDTSHAVLHGVLKAVSLVEVGLVMEELELEPSVRQDSSFVQ